MEDEGESSGGTGNSLFSSQSLPYPRVWAFTYSPPQTSSRTGHHHPSPGGLKGPPPSKKKLISSHPLGPLLGFSHRLEMSLRVCDSLSQKPSMASHCVSNAVNTLTTKALYHLAPTCLVFPLTKLQLQRPGLRSSSTSCSLLAQVLFAGCSICLENPFQSP